VPSRRGNGGGRFPSQKSALARPGSGPAPGSSAPSFFPFLFYFYFIFSLYLLNLLPLSASGGKFALSPRTRSGTGRTCRARRRLGVEPEAAPPLCLPLPHSNAAPPPAHWLPPPPPRLLPHGTRLPPHWTVRRSYLHGAARTNRRPLPA